MGFLAAETLLDRMAHPDSGGHAEHGVAPELIARESTAPVRA
jgi:DNA-binding LacI/PurR family transcriptional regulator